MKEGKLSNSDLEKQIIKKLEHNREDILIGSGVGEDCAAIAFGDLACVLTTDPITGATKDVGKLAVQIACNDIASSGISPAALLMTLLLPLNASKEEPEQIMTQAQEVASKLGVAIIGGHTEFTSAVTRTVVSVTAIGKGPQKKLTATKGAKAGDLVVISKWPALEGTAIICNEFSDKLREEQVSERLIEQGISLLDQISVLEEGLLASEHGVHAMHDVTEGGLLGAVWEMCEASGLGVQIEMEKVPLLEITKEVCRIFSLDPLRLISSGVMLMAFPKESIESFEASCRQKHIPITVIGKFTESKERQCRTQNLGTDIAPPDVDELYKVFQ